MKDNAYIKVISGSVYPKSFEIDKSTLSFGRNKSSDIVIDDKKVSRNHARIISGGGIYKIEDLNSRNGTYVNGSKISGGKVLNSGDSIKIGDNEFILSTHKQKKKTVQNNKPLLIAIILIILLVPSIVIPTYMFTGNSRIGSYDDYDVVEEVVPIEEYEDVGDGYDNDQQLIEETLGELRSNIEETGYTDLSDIDNLEEALSSLIYNWEDIIYSMESLPNFPGKGDVLNSAKSVLSSLNEINMFLDDYDLIHLGNAVIDLYNALDNLDSLLTGLL